jgi:hypothetical protein
MLSMNRFLIGSAVQMLTLTTCIASTICQTDSIQLRTNTNSTAFVNEAYECFGYYNKTNQQNNGKNCLTYQAAINQINQLSRNRNNDVRLVGGRDFLITLNNKKYIVSEFFLVGSPAYVSDIDVANSTNYNDMRQGIRIPSMSSQSLVGNNNLNYDFSENGFLSLPQMKNLTLKFQGCN